MRPKTHAFSTAATTGTFTRHPDGLLTLRSKSHKYELGADAKPHVPTTVIRSIASPLRFTSRPIHDYTLPKFLSRTHDEYDGLPGLDYLPSRNHGRNVPGSNASLLPACQDTGRGSHKHLANVLVTRESLRNPWSFGESAVSCQTRLASNLLTTPDPQHMGVDSYLLPNHKADNFLIFSLKVPKVGRSGVSAQLQGFVTGPRCTFANKLTPLSNCTAAPNPVSSRPIRSVANFGSPFILHRGVVLSCAALNWFDAEAAQCSVLEGCDRCLKALGSWLLARSLRSSGGTRALYTPPPGTRERPLQPDKPDIAISKGGIPPTGPPPPGPWEPLRLGAAAGTAQDRVYLGHSRLVREKWVEFNDRILCQRGRQVTPSRSWGRQGALAKLTSAGEWVNIGGGTILLLHHAFKAYHAVVTWYPWPFSYPSETEELKSIKQLTT
ncbi:hypothetical protein Bbelb_272820 [Branchiostoma belcheri]|nr:hypothetical protein Bbelb_272820 [Branchiostoma belcheri]